jgi:NADH-quinone oxidoreductase subunit F
MTKFYSHESCGQCTPCRIGTSWIDKIVKRIGEGKGEKGDLETILRLASNIKGKTLCPLGDAASLPIISLTRKFYKELESYLPN